MNNEILGIIDQLGREKGRKEDRNEKEIKELVEKCKKIISDISYKEFEKYIMLLKDNNVDDAVQILYNIHDYGYSVIDILDKFYAFVKNTELIDEDKKYNLLPILCKYITYFHNLHEDIIEIVLFTQDFYQSLLN